MSRFAFVSGPDASDVLDVTLNDVYTCGDHTPDTVRPTPDVVLFHGAATDGTCAESETFAVFLAGGVLYAVDEAADATGHGCQCGGTIGVFPDFASAVRLGLTSDQREALCAWLRGEPGVDKAFAAGKGKA